MGKNPIELDIVSWLRTAELPAGLPYIELKDELIAKLETADTPEKRLSLNQALSQPEAQNSENPQSQKSAALALLWGIAINRYLEEHPEEAKGFEN